MAKADPLKSEGARLERKAWLAFVRRRANSATDAVVSATLDEIVKYGETRRARYDKTEGGLGKRKLR